MAAVTTPGLTRNYQAWAAISATPGPFSLDAGAYGLLLTASVFGTVTLQKFAPDGSTLETITTVTANGYQELHLPAGWYQLTLSGVTSLTGSIEKITSGS